MSEPTATDQIRFLRVRGWIAIAGLILGIFAVGYTFQSNRDSIARTNDNLTAFTAVSCERQHAAAEQWDSVIAVITELRASGPPIAPDSAAAKNFTEFVTKTKAIYDVFPACKGFDYNPKTIKATPQQQ